MASKREGLLLAAKKLLWERGYEGTSPRDIQDECDAGQGSFYHHFESKLDLAATALGEVSTEMRDDASDLLNSELPGLERVALFLGRARDGLKGCRMGRFAAEASIAEPKIRAPVKRYFDHLESLLTAALDEAKQSGTLQASVEPRALAAMLIAAVQGGFVLSRIHRDRAAINRATAAALALLRSSTTSRR